MFIQIITAEKGVISKKNVIVLDRLINEVVCYV